MSKPIPATSYPISPLIQKRWSPRAYAAKTIPTEQINSLLEAARWAASAMNEQPWRFIFATRDQTDRFSQLLACLNDPNQVWAKDAPLIILTMVKTKFAGSGQPNPWAQHDLGLAIGNLTTQATELGLFLHSMAGFSIDKTKTTFHLADDLQPVTMIAVGYLGNLQQLPEPLQAREIAPQSRLALADLIISPTS